MPVTDNMFGGPSVYINLPMPMFEVMDLHYAVVLLDVKYAVVATYVNLYGYVPLYGSAFVQLK